MPIYEYRCDSCKDIFEKIQSFDAAPPEVCPKCGHAGAIEKVVSKTSFILKGGGWYKDGYSGPSNGVGSSEGSSSSESSSDSSSSESSSTSSSSESSSSSSASSSSDSSSSSSASSSSE